MIYNQKNKTVSVVGEVPICFFCGDTLDSLAEIVLQLRFGELSAQEAYTLLLKREVNL